MVARIHSCLIMVNFVGVPLVIINLQPSYREKFKVAAQVVVLRSCQDAIGSTIQS